MCLENPKAIQDNRGTLRHGAYLLKLFIHFYSFAVPVSVNGSNSNDMYIPLEKKWCTLVVYFAKKALHFGFSSQNFKITN